MSEILPLPPHAPILFNEADFTDITPSPNGEVPTAAQVLYEGSGVFMRMYDAFSVGQLIARGTASEAEAKKALTPAYVVFTLSRGNPALVLMSPDGQVRGEATIIMNDVPTAEIWNYESASETADATVAFPPPLSS